MREAYVKRGFSFFNEDCAIFFHFTTEVYKSMSNFNLNPKQKVFTINMLKIGISIFSKHRSFKMRLLIRRSVFEGRPKSDKCMTNPHLFVFEF